MPTQAHTPGHADDSMRQAILIWQDKYAAGHQASSQPRLSEKIRRRRSCWTGLRGHIDP